MRVLSKLHSTAGIWLTDVECPKVGPNDLLIKINKSAICGTDIHIYNWDTWAQQTIPIPLIIGHEFTGRVIEIGSEVIGFKIGDRVSGEGHITCNYCRNCRAGRRHLCSNTLGIGVQRNGCFAEYLCLPAFNAIHIPDNISDDIAAILDPLGNAVHTALAFDLIGENVLITGAGPIGIMAYAIAKHVGARNIIITDVNDYRLSLAQKIGAQHILNVQQDSLSDLMAELNIHEGFAVGLEMSGNIQAIKTMLEHMQPGGKMALLGIPSIDIAIDWNKVIFKGLTLKGIYGREMFETWFKMLQMLQSGLDISPIITHQFPATQFQQGFDIMRSGASGKVILNWTT